MVVRSDVVHDTRVRREAVALAEAGHEVHVVGRDVPGGWDAPAGVTVGSVGARSSLERRRPPRERPLPPHLRLARWALLPRHNASTWRSFLAEVRADVGGGAPGGGSGPGWEVVHAHDFPVLPLSVELADRWGSALVYDSHEWWSGRLRAGRPTPLADRRERVLERRLGARADLVLTVSEGIASRLRAWGWSRVHVVRNTFPMTGAPPPVATAAPAGIVYAGRIGLGRDLDTAAAAARPGRPLVLLGHADASYAARLASRPGVELRAGVDPDAVDDVLRQVGLALVTLEDTCDNHRLALPNKLFHAVRAGVPVVAADLPEMRQVVLRHGIGTLYRPGDSDSLTSAVDAAWSGYARHVAALVAAREELAWERDAHVLVSAYGSLRPPRRSAGPSERHRLP